MKRILTHWLMPVLTLAVLCAWGLSDPFVKQTARLKSFDLIQKYDTPTLSKDIAIVEIDEKSIAKYGQWPWSRNTIADIVWRLREAGAGVIVLPILFSEADRLGGDTVLSNALKGNGVIIAQTGTTQANQKCCAQRSGQNRRSTALAVRMARHVGTNTRVGWISRRCGCVEHST
jgi:CHASE2 domain-containing sensor protein